MLWCLWKLEFTGHLQTIIGVKVNLVAIAMSDQGSLHFHPPPHKRIEWIAATTCNATRLSHKALVAGKEPGQNGCPLWVIRAYYDGDLLPGKLAAIEGKASVPYDSKEVFVDNFEVLCTRMHYIDWVPAVNGQVPAGAVPGGNTHNGETLYIGRVGYEDSLTPGKIHPKNGCLYITFGGAELAFKNYEVLCEIC